MESKQIIQVKVALYRDKPGVDDWYSNISTAAPDFTKSSNAQIPSTMPTTWPVSKNKEQLNFEKAQYYVKTFQTGAYSFKPNTTYYIWLYSTTPIGETTRGYFANNWSTQLPMIKVQIGFQKAATPSKLYYKPEVVKIYGKKGFYHQMQAMIPTDEKVKKEYPYIYARSTTKDPNAKWYKRNNTFEVELDDGKYEVFSIWSEEEHTWNDRTVEVIRCSQNLTNDAVNRYDVKGCEYNPPKFVCEAYCHSPTPRLVFESWQLDANNKNKTGTATFNEITFNNYWLLGATTDIEKKDNPEFYGADGFNIILQYLNSMKDEYGNELYGGQMNGLTVYGIFQNKFKLNYYRGTNVLYTYDKKIKLNFYGIDGIYIVDNVNPETSYAGTEKDWVFKGWSQHKESQQYDTLINILQQYPPTEEKENKDIITLYCIYENKWSIDYKIPNSESNDSYIAEGTTTTVNYIYGDGIRTENIPNEPSESDKIIGWKLADDTSEEPTVYTWEQVCKEVQPRPTSVIAVIDTNIDDTGNTDIVPNQRIIDEGTWKKLYKIYSNNEWEPVYLTTNTFDYIEKSEASDIENI